MGLWRFSGKGCVCFVKCMAILADVGGKHPLVVLWSAWRFWRMSVFATFICFVLHLRPKTAKWTRAELWMAFLTLLTERRVWNFCDRSCFVAHFAKWECSIWRFWRFQFRPHTGLSGRLGTTDQANTTTSAPRTTGGSLSKEAWAITLPLHAGSHGLNREARLRLSSLLRAWGLA